MKNKEKFAKEIFDISCGGSRIAIEKENNKVMPCLDMNCEDCVFYLKRDCRSNIKEWCEAEYIGPGITIPKDTPVDTKILVSDDGVKWFKRYYAKMTSDQVYAWDNGSTSWSARNAHVTGWDYGKLAEVED